MRSILNQSLDLIESAGFGYIKVELEGVLKRRYTDKVWTCYSCLGVGYSGCDCDGGIEGALFHERCAGSGVIACSLCGGQKHLGNFSSERTCSVFVLNELAKEMTGKKIHELSANDNMTALYKFIPGLVYSKFYYDGSVDSEWTFTLPLSECRKLPLYIDAFKKLALECNGTGAIDVRGAGMHISVLPTASGGVYPYSDWRMEPHGYDNFVKQVTKLLPAMYFLSAANKTTRPLKFREPRISYDKKYSAIYSHNKRCLEYRIFDTCYERPETIFEFIEVIANTLKFYKDPTLSVKPMNRTFGFVETREITKYYENITNLKVLNHGLKYIRPRSKTLKKVKADRGMFLTTSSLSLQEKRRMVALREEYRAIVDKYQEIMGESSLSREAEEWISDNMAWEGNSPDEALRQYRMYHCPEPPSFEVFVERNLRKTKSITALAV